MATRRSTKKANVRRLIDRMVKRIVRRFQTETIILFGSQARGDAGPDSDVDLLVGMSCTGDQHDNAVEILIALDDIVVPTDVVVTSPEGFTWRKEVVGTVEWPAAREGTMLYARSWDGDRGDPGMDSQSRQRSMLRRSATLI
jgi:predicted nucleotidyltransferase